MYNDPHVKVTIELTSNPGSTMATSYARAEVSELAMFGKALDGQDSDLTSKHVERAYQEIGEALVRALRYAEEQVNTQLGRLRAEGLDKVVEREVEQAHVPQAQ